MKTYQIIYINAEGKKKEWNMRAYSVAQAKYVFHKLVKNCKEITHISY